MIARPSRPRLVRWAVLTAVWLATAVLVGGILFLGGSRSIALAGHDAEVSPTTSGHVVFRTGPVLPDLRLDSPAPLGVDIDLGKTDAESTEELFSRYALIASNVDPQVAQVRGAITDLAVASLLRGLAVGALPVVVYLLIGPGRRREVWQDLRSFRLRPVLAVLLVLAAVVALWQPWDRREERIAAERDWIPLEEFLGDGVPVPEQLQEVEVSGDTTATETQRLIGSAVDTYAQSREFYDDAVEAAAELELRTPADDETVVVLLSDRHDNVGMDRVARAVGDRAGATAVFGGGDDTSTGKPWEAFSLDSMQETFGDLQRWFVTGNHDHGTFVGERLSDAGWLQLEGEVVEGPGGGRLLGVPDPRSSGLGNWRDETGVGFSEVRERLADLACASEEAGERINTILVHDANLGKEALARGCADLVVGGHTHVPDGPTAVEGENGQVGYTYTNGTTGGAAYAIAVGSKPRRDASISLITYDATGRPLGVQLVMLRTNGRFEVEPFAPLALPEGI